MAGKLKILVVSANPSLKGGTNRVMATVLRALAGEYDFTLLGLAGSKSIYPLPAGIEVLTLGPEPARSLGPVGKVASSAASVPRLMRILAARCPDIVVSLQPRPNIVNVLLKHLSGADYTCIVCERNFTSVQFGSGRLNRVIRLAIKAAYRRADLVVANAHAMAEDLQRSYGVPQARIRTVSNPVDMAAIAQLAASEVASAVSSSNAPLILTVGRLLPQKNHDLLIRAFARARARVRCRLALIGEGPLLERTRRLAAELSVADDVLFLGWQDNPFVYMKRAALFALSSNHEGFPNVLVEAMACGCPVVSTDCPSGPREILQSGRSGILVPVDDEAALADAFVRVLEDEAYRATLGRKAYARALDFDLPAVLDSYRSLFSSV
jgi:glycosyltransferase involved in cell wall biosynthesis